MSLLLRYGTCPQLLSASRMMHSASVDSERLMADASLRRLELPAGESTPWRSLPAGRRVGHMGCARACGCCESKCTCVCVHAKQVDWATQQGMGR